MGELAPWHWLIVAAVFILLFGSSKLPGAARSLGRSLRILKSEVSGLHTDDELLPNTAATPMAEHETPAHTTVEPKTGRLT
jgi:sec-independent protein translocase protein TatA